MAQLSQFDEELYKVDRHTDTHTDRHKDIYTYGPTEIETNRRRPALEKNLGF